MAKLAYVRVSTVEQNEERQLENLKRYNIEKWYVEKISAKNTNRPQLNAMLDYAREGDTIFIHDFSRLARSTNDLLEIIDYLQKKNIILVNMTPKQIEKELNRQAALFEEKCKTGKTANNKQIFAQYADYVLKLKERTGAKHKTIEL